VRQLPALPLNCALHALLTFPKGASGLELYPQIQFQSIGWALSCLRQYSPLIKLCLNSDFTLRGLHGVTASLFTSGVGDGTHMYACSLSCLPASSISRSSCIRYFFEFLSSLLPHWHGRWPPLPSSMSALLLEHYLQSWSRVVVLLFLLGLGIRSIEPDFNYVWTWIW
jgi:hypothetical protein